MHVAVLGASGKGGSEIVKELVARGHTVTGIARSPDAIPQLDGVTAKAGDASKPASDEAANNDTPASICRFPAVPPAPPPPASMPTSTVPSRL